MSTNQNGDVTEKVAVSADDDLDTLVRDACSVVPVSKGEYRARLLAWRDEAVREIEKAYGSCKNCYGKGYATVNDQWIGHDTDQDIGSLGGVIRGGEPIAMKFCGCDRGKQLARLTRKGKL